VRETAERASSAQAIVCPAPADAVLRLAWLSPSAASLAVLGRPPTETTWPQVRHDPGAVLLVLRRCSLSQTGRGSSAPPLPFYTAALCDPLLAEDALAGLDRPGGFVDWGRPEVRPVYEAGLSFARLARQLAVRIGRCDPEAAWACGLLAPLGWLAVCAADPSAVAACLGDPALSSDPAAVQRRHWGLDQDALARRLARQWGLPGWIAAAAGHLGLPSTLARAFGADPVLHPLTRLAIDAARGRGLDLHLSGTCFAAEDRATVLGDAAGLWDPASQNCRGEVPSPQSKGEGTSPLPPVADAPTAWEDPRRVPLLRDLLAAAAENRRLRGRALHGRLEEDVDVLHRALEEQVREEGRRLEAAKLTALAEFAAGAGHEINNPLAVISGQAQYLLGHQADWAPGDVDNTAGKALQAILTQTRRIHGILRDLMQFARPTAPRPAWFDLPSLLGEVAAGLGEFAAARRVRLEVVAPDRLAMHADAGHLRLALTCLLRNAVEAAPPDGWARLVLKEPAGAAVEVAVEDSGPGPEPAHRSSLFDPFFSGRTAGRGRGLGLPIAWRLTRQQGGDVRLDAAEEGGPTRFVMTLPRPAAAEGGDAPSLLQLPLAAGTRHAC
jgi:signal transduction histidine kinase